MHFRPEAIAKFIESFQDKHNPVVHRALRVSKREKELSFRVESKHDDTGCGEVRRKFYLTFDGKSHMRVDKTPTRIIFSSEDPQRVALEKKRNILHQRLTPEKIKADPRARRMYQQMMAFHKRLQGPEFMEPRYVITSPDRMKFEQLFIKTRERYIDFTPEHKDVLMNEFLPKLKSVFPKPNLAWWGFKPRVIGVTRFFVFETYHYQGVRREVHKRFILSHVEETEHMNMVYGIDGSNRAHFMFGFYRPGFGDGKFGSINDRALFPDIVVDAFNQMESSARKEDQDKSSQLGKSFEPAF